VSNVGGISETTVRLDPGITVLAGRNASNRTSLLQAIAASVGSEQASIKGDADRAEVSLELDGETYTRTLRRSGDAVVAEGDAFVSDPEVADLFAFAFGWNEARRAVVDGDDLRAVIMRPVDTDRINAEIDRLESRKDRIDGEIDEIDELASDLPELERRRSELESELADRRAELEAARERLSAANADPEQRAERQAELERRLDDLSDRRSALEDARFDVESEASSLESLREERASLRERRSELPEFSDGRIDEIDRELDRLRERKRSLESSINQLDRMVEFNEGMIDGEADRILDAVRVDGTSSEPSGDASVTDQLVDDDRVTCWTCGTEVERLAISETLDGLRSFRRDRVEERSDVSEEIDSLKAERARISDARDERERIDVRLERIDDETGRREDRLEAHRERVAELETTVAELETEVERLQSTEDDDVLERQRTVSDLEHEVETLESDLGDVEEDVAGIEDRIERRDELEAERGTVVDRLNDARTRIERIENEAIEAFNVHMENLLEALDYENLERVWIERTETETREGRRTVSRPEFDLHVVRTTEDGVAYEDTIDHLSESERELIGLVFTLSGYLAHEVYADVPFVLLDSLEAIDSERIASLVDYFGQYAEYLVVALLPEDARAVDPDHRITSI
jgi:chromosome segregation ATPase